MLNVIAVELYVIQPVLEISTSNLLVWKSAGLKYIFFNPFLRAKILGRKQMLQDYIKSIGGNWK
jgi:hypothetical protein